MQAFLPTPGIILRTKLQGFTLLEVLVVLGIMGLIATLLATQISSSGDHYQMGRNAREIVSAVRMARTRAIETQKDSVIYFNINDKTYHVDNDKPRAIDKAIDIEVFASEVDVSTAKNEAGIRFYDDGTSSGGRVTLLLDKEKRDIDVVWMTGQVSLMDTTNAQQ